ncbi:MAG: heavy-metal-associated domain-containing protein [Nitrospirae bacterium]|nr:heavy-metal-associated domain-containing protein [Nitrospirota bacterium]
MALDPRLVIPDEPKGAIGKDTEEAIFHIDGMTCSDCIKEVQRAIMKVSGVIDARVTLKGFFRTEGRADIKYEKGKVTPDQLIRAVSSASNAMYTYKAHLLETK